MIEYISTKGGISPARFDEAVLQGFASDGGLFVPQTIPRIPDRTLSAMSQMSYTGIVYEILSLFIDKAVIPETDLKQLIDTGFSLFDHPDLLPVVPMDTDKNLYCMELFHGPTLSFKDIAMGFLIHTMDYLLHKRDRHLSLILATTGDTGPAAAFAAAGKKTIDCWPLYPLGMISKEQERQMTTLAADNIHPVSVSGCQRGGDDIDVIVAALFSQPELKKRLNLSSVNSINWCRVMVQAAHYAYGYFKICSRVGEPVDVCVPSGAFGNLFAGFLARKMGIPIRNFICANNKNHTLHTVFSTGVFKKEDLRPSLSSAIDIVVPYNFWRFLYFSCNRDPEKMNQWMDMFERTGEIRLDKKTLANIQKGFKSVSISDEQTLTTIQEIWKKKKYLLDPHSAVSVCAATILGAQVKNRVKTICLATAHPAKFPDVIQQALGPGTPLPEQAFHPSIESAKNSDETFESCDLDCLETFLIHRISRTGKTRSN